MVFFVLGWYLKITMVCLVNFPWAARLMFPVGCASDGRLPTATLNRALIGRILNRALIGRRLFLCFPWAARPMFPVGCASDGRWPTATLNRALIGRRLFVCFPWAARPMDAGPRLR